MCSSWVIFKTKNIGFYIRVLFYHLPASLFIFMKITIPPSRGIKISASFFGIFLKYAGLKIIRLGRRAVVKT